eukprot:gb/GFBE01022178.1/.p1 GENE.gb/GFBE01022178.1/~~gb/GFBE01022178.1/.p1  ORF type:complete len:118 (+),score=12.25 gb/GFBE01022178.1/:2-355(+)
MAARSAAQSMFRITGAPARLSPLAMVPEQRVCRVNSLLLAQPEVLGRLQLPIPTLPVRTEVDALQLPAGDVSSPELHEPDSGSAPLQAVSTRKELRRWKWRRKRDGGRDRKFRLKYG